MTFLMVSWCTYINCFVFVLDLGAMHIWMYAWPCFRVPLCKFLYGLLLSKFSNLIFIFLLLFFIFTNIGSFLRKFFWWLEKKKLSSFCHFFHFCSFCQSLSYTHVEVVMVRKKNCLPTTLCGPPLVCSLCICFYYL